MTEDFQVFSGVQLGLETAFRQAGVKEIHVRGDVTPLEGPLIALVGTRHPDGDGLAMARRLAEVAVRNRYVVVSGGALGIDAAVHTATLTAGGRTVVVLPSGLEQPYPRRHRALYDRIVANGGTIVSPFRADTPPTVWTFAKRNGVVAALCEMLVVVQAPADSGALIAADLALKMGRRVFAVPSAPNDRRGAGCLALLRRGAELCASASDLEHALLHSDGPLLLPQERTKSRSITKDTESSDPKSRAKRTKVTSAPAPVALSELGLDPAQLLCAESVRGGPMHPDTIAKSTSLTAAQVRVALMTLVLLGVVVERTDGRFLLAQS